MKDILQIISNLINIINQKLFYFLFFYLFNNFRKTFVSKSKIENKSLRDERSDRSSNICFGSDINKEQFISE